jgi:hypothetical protein
VEGRTYIQKYSIDCRNSLRLEKRKSQSMLFFHRKLLNFVLDGCRSERKTIVTASPKGCLDICLSFVFVLFIMKECIEWR